MEPWNQLLERLARPEDAPSDLVVRCFRSMVEHVSGEAAQEAIAICKAGQIDNREAERRRKQIAPWAACGCKAETVVVNSRLLPIGRWRRRKCLRCGHAFATVEVEVADLRESERRVLEHDLHAMERARKRTKSA